VAGVAFVLAVGYLGSRTCKTESASVTISFRVGDAGGELQRLEAELHRPGEDEVIGFYKREFERGSGPEAGRWELRADDGLYRTRIALRTSRGTIRVERAVDLQDGAVITIDLEPDLSAR